MTSPRNTTTAVHFFKIIQRPSLAHGILKLPKDFTTKYGDRMSNPVFLKPPDGTEWKIYWTMLDGHEVWFQKGWKEYVTYYSLDHGHFLLFQYHETSHFDVHIFDNSAVEVDYPQPCSKEMKSGLTTNVEGSTSSQKENIMNQEVDDEGEGKGIFNPKCPKVEQLTSTTLKKATTFRLVMKSSFINGDYLEIPTQFAEQYLKKTHAAVLLENLDGKTWPIICSSSKITKGWKKFALENNLNVGDVCVFELIQNLTFKVSIFQGSEEPSCLISQGGSSRESSSQFESQCKSKILETRAHEEARKFTSENPFFMVTLACLRKNVIKRPFVTNKFVRKYFANMEQNMVKIQLGNKLWPVKLVLSECNAGTLSAGWFSFARENKLQSGDVCIFELVNREDAILDVHVFRG